MGNTESERMSHVLIYLYLTGFASWRALRALGRRLWRRRSGYSAVSEIERSENDGSTLQRNRRPRVLLVHPYPILPPYHGGGVRNSNLIYRLADRCDLYAFVYSSIGDDPAQRKGLAPYCKKVFVHRRDPVPPSETWDLMPRGAQFLRFQQVGERLRDIVEAEDIDIVQLEYAEMGQYARFLGEARVVLTEHDLSFVSSRRRREIGFHRRFETDRDLWADRLSWLKLFRFELQVSEAADQVHLMSTADANMLAPLMTDGWRRLRVLPNGVDTLRFSLPETPVREPRVLFLGSFGHTPNLDAVEYLLDEVWPLVRLRVPDATLTLVGAHPPDNIRARDGWEGVQVVGTVADTVAQFQSHRALAAPIRVGSGTRLKILEAFATGLPVITTTVGAEGITCEHEENCLIADEPGSFAEQLSRVLTDDSLCDALARAGRRLVVEHYDWNHTVDRIVECYQELLTTAPEVRQTLEPSIEDPNHTVDISVVIPTLNGGSRLLQCIGAIQNQLIDRSVEIVCVDSGSRSAELAALGRCGVRVESVPPKTFNHGLTRDHGARLSTGRILVFLNQDAVPIDRLWLHRITSALSRPGSFAAIQGGIRESPSREGRFYWDSGGDRFYFTSESKNWIEQFDGIGFSTVNAAIRREVWERIPFGWAPIMEDKKWQRRVVEAGYKIGTCAEAAVYHTHDYTLRGLVRRCQSEGWGWRMIGERYRFQDALSDIWSRSVMIDLARGLRHGRIRSPAEAFFPLLRPLSVYWGNRWSQGVKLG